MCLGHYQPLQPWVSTWTTCTAQGCPEAGLSLAITSAHPSEWREKTRQHACSPPKSVLDGERHFLLLSATPPVPPGVVFLCGVSLSRTKAFPFPLGEGMSWGWRCSPRAWVRCCLWCKETGFESCTHMSSGLPPSLRPDEHWAFYWQASQLFHFSVNMQIFSGCRHSVKRLLMDLYSNPYQLPGGGPFSLPLSLFSESGLLVDCLEVLDWEKWCEITG